MNRIQQARIFPPPLPDCGQRESRRVASKGNGGFSLVEVALALGVVSFGLLSLFALLPTGMATFRSALDTAIETRIVEQIAAGAEETDFDSLANLHEYFRYFDGDGVDLGATPAATSIYTVRVDVARSQLPGGGMPSSNLLTLTIRTVHDPGHFNDPFGAGSVLKPVTRAVFIGRNATKVQ